MCSLLINILAQQALSTPEREAFVFLENGETSSHALKYGELWSRVNARASGLFGLELYQKPVLLLFPAGLEYIEAFLSCLASGAIAVPIYPPRSSKHADRLAHILQDSGAQTILTDSKQKEKLLSFENEIIQKCEVLCLDDLEPDASFDAEQQQQGENVAFLQYTSGSTGNPKGVVVSNNNLLSNEEQINNAIHQSAESVIVSWLPMYHDMGLIGNILLNVFLGSKCVFFSPIHFLQKPVRWLRAISEYKATLTGAPNFAYDLLNDLHLEGEDIDLSTVEIFFNGAEKVRFDTLKKFSAKYSVYGLRNESIYPCYGLAEATLMVAGPDKFHVFNSVRTSLSSLEKKELSFDPKGEIELVSCGKIREGITCIIVDDDNQPCTSYKIGKIYINGPNVSGKYWNRKQEDAIHRVNGMKFLDTGDLGAIVNGELYVTGRRKEILIKNGVNYYPYDLERLVSNSNEALALNGCAVVSFDSGEKEKLIVISEIKRSYFRAFDEKEILKGINEALSQEFGFIADEIVLISPMSIPKTSSGKIQRGKCLELYQSNDLKILSSLSDVHLEGEASLDGWVETAEEEPEGSNVLETLKVTINHILGVSGQLTSDSELSKIGLDSIQLMKLTTSIDEKYNFSLDLDIVFSDITLQELAETIEHGKSDTREDCTSDDSVSLNAEGLWLGNQNGLDNNKIGFAFRIEGDNFTNRVEETLRSALEALNWKGKNFFYEDGSVKCVRGNTSLFDTYSAGSLIEFNLKSNALFSEKTQLESDGLIQLLTFYDEGNNTTHAQLIAHHIISDGISLALLFDNWVSALKNEQLETVPPNQNNRIAREKELILNEPFVTEALKFFQSTVDGVELNQILSVTEETSELMSTSFVWNKSKFRQIATEMEVSPFVLGLSIYQLALSYLSSCQHICTVSPFANRTHADSANRFDYLVNLMYLRGDFRGEQTLKGAVQSLNRVFKESRKYLSIPYIHLLRQASLPEETMEALGIYFYAYQSFGEYSDFQKLFEAEDQLIAQVSEGIYIKNDPQPEFKGNFKMEFELVERANDLCGKLLFDTDTFSKEFGDALVVTMNQLFETLDHPEVQINDLNVSFKTNNAVLYGKKQEFAENHFLQLFDRAVRDYPENVALMQGDRSMTYLELDELSNGVAQKLVENYEVKTNDAILLMSEFNLDELVCMLGVMKAGAIYVPVNRSLPNTQLQRVAHSTHAKYIIGENVEIEVVTTLSCTELSEIRSQYRSTNEVSGSAYIIFTSGTSGVPKGVQINQSGLVNLCYSLKEAYKLTQDDRVLQFASLSFDMSVEEIFPYWSVGGTVVMRKEETIDSLTSFSDYCAENNATLLNLPTAFWEETVHLDNLPESVRLIAIGGEKLNYGSVNKWLNKWGKSLRLVNAYGPTEYTVNATLKNLVDSNQRAVSIGQPILNTTVSVVNHRNQQLPKGVTGELVLKGDGIANGYLNAEKGGSSFMTVQGEKVYKTGDLAYIDSKGELFLLGRKDTQVKVRGYRVEPDAIKECLERQKEVQICEVLLHNGSLIAFVTTLVPNFNSEKITSELGRELPTYSIPSRIILVDSIPVTHHGKVDRKRLLQAMENEPQEIVQVETETEKAIVTIWKGVLENKELGVTTNFFELGGNSIRAIKVLSTVKTELGQSIGLKVFYENPTVRGLATYVDTLMWMQTRIKSAGENEDEITI